ASVAHSTGQADPPTTAIPGTQATADSAHAPGQTPGDAAIPGTSGTAPGRGSVKEQVRGNAQPRPDHISHGMRATAGTRAGKAARAARQRTDTPGQAAMPGQAAVPGQGAAPGQAAAPDAATADTAIIPGLPIMAQRLSARPAAPSAAPTAPAGSQRAGSPGTPVAEANPHPPLIPAL